MVVLSHIVFDWYRVSCYASFVFPLHACSYAVVISVGSRSPLLFA